MSSASTKKINWQTIVDMKSNILNMSVSCYALRRHYIKKALDIDYEYKSAYYFDNTIAYSDEDFKNFFIHVQNKIKDNRYFLTFPQRVYALAESLLNFSRQLQTVSSFSDKSNIELQKKFSEFIERLAMVWPTLMIVAPIEIIINGELDQYIRKQLSKEQTKGHFEDYFQALTQRSSRETYFQQDHRSLLKLGREIQKDDALLKKLDSLEPSDFLHLIKLSKQAIYQRLMKHNQTFGWLNMNFFRRNPFTVEDQIGRLKDIVKKNCLAQLKDLDAQAKKTEEAFNNAVKELKLTGNFKKKVELLGEYVYLRTFRMDVISLAIYYARDLLLEIASRLGISYDELAQLTIWEINDLLLGKINVDQIPLNKRRENFAVIQIDGQFNIITDKMELKSLLAEKRKTSIQKIRIIKGSVASKGRAKGPVRIVMHPTQLTKVQKGDVLVAPMTSPDYVMGMLKAVAIVTDHGGITCHAAIVSRELGIPCIVGTRNATELLHDDDLVEVDAVGGKVTILKSR